MINLIWAMTKDGTIAKDNKLPWSIKEEMKYFQKMTMNKTIVMGSKTFDSIGKPLKNRTNIVLTRNPDKYKNIEGIVLDKGIKSLIKEFAHNKDNDLWVIGGAKIYNEFLPDADYLYVSEIKKDYPGDLKFNDVNWDNFKVESINEYPEFTAYIWKRK